VGADVQAEDQTSDGRMNISQDRHTIDHYKIVQVN